MRSSLWVVGCLVAGTANAAPNLSVAGSCPGPMLATISGLTPGGAYYVVRARDAGVSVVPSGPCAGTELRLDAASPGWSASMLTAPASGTAVIPFTASASMCDRRFEVVDVGSCEVSNVWDFLHPQCNPAEVYLGTEADLASLSVCQTLNDVYIAQPGFAGGSLLLAIDLPELVHLDTLTSEMTGMLASVALPALRRVHGSILLWDSPLLSSFSAPAWGGTSEGLQFSYMTDVSELYLPELEGIDWIQGSFGGPITLPSLTRLRAASLAGPFTSVDLGALESVHDLSIGSPAVTTVDLGALRLVGEGGFPYVSSLSISNNPVLTHVDLHSLEEADSVWMFNNPMLCPETATALYPDWSAITVWNTLAIGLNQPGCFERRP